MSGVLLVMTIVGYGLATAGAALFLVAALGLVRFPDVYSRISAVTKAATLGLILILVGVLLIDPSWRVAIAVFLAVNLQLATSPVGGYALGRAAYRSGAPLAPGSRYDEFDGRADSPEPRP